MNVLSRGRRTTRLSARWLSSLVAPRAANEDTARKEYIFNVLLLGSITLTAVAFLLILAYIGLLHSPRRNGVSPLVIGTVLVVFTALYGANRLKFRPVLPFVFILLYFLLGTFSVYQWGILIAQSWIVYVFVIVMSSVLLGTLYGLLATLLILLAVAAITYLQLHGFVHPDLAWVNRQGQYGDIIVYGFSLGVMSIVTWLSNREIDKSLKRVRTSEALLKKERNSLEVKVEERTRQLRKTQREEIAQLHRFATFGREATELLHDLVAPLTSVSLNLKAFTATKRHQLMTRAVRGIETMERFIASARKQIQQQDELSFFRPLDELQLAKEILQGRIRKNDVHLELLVGKDLEIYGDPIRFHKVAINLLTNAIDACAHQKGARLVAVRMEKTASFVRLMVEDNGVGIEPEQLRHIFKPFFTTKAADTGIGIGLAIVKEIVENDLGGTIKVTSRPHQKTVVTCETPIIRPNARIR